MTSKNLSFEVTSRDLKIGDKGPCFITPVMTIPIAPAPLSISDIAQRIHLIRGQRVVLDTDLAAFYGETTKRFNQQVNRNRNRFPEDFMFQLNEDEFTALRLQFATLKTGRGQHRNQCRLTQFSTVSPG